MVGGGSGVGFRARFQAKREQLKMSEGLLPGSQCLNLASTVLFVPCSLRSGKRSITDAAVWTRFEIGCISGVVLARLTERVGHGGGIWTGLDSGRVPSPANAGSRFRSRVAEMCTALLPSSEYGKKKTVETRFWHWLSGERS